MPPVPKSTYRPLRILPDTLKFRIYRIKLIHALRQHGIDARVLPFTASQSLRNMVTIEVAKEHYAKAHEVELAMDDQPVDDADASAT